MSLARNDHKTKSFSELNLPANFDNDTVSSYCTFTYFEAFKNAINFKGLLRSVVTYQKPVNSTFSTADVLDCLIDTSILGYFRFQHLEDFRQDLGYLQIKGLPIPSEKVFRDLLKQLPEKSRGELIQLNEKLLALQAENEPPRDLVLDFDDTVCTVFGKQEGTGTGYNPKYHGRASYKEKVCVISKTHELVNATLENGKHHTNHEFLEFFMSCKNTLPDDWYIKRVRGDAGLFDQNNFNYFEDQSIEYLIKARKVSSIHKIVDYVNKNQDEFPWQKIDKIYSVTEVRTALPAWEKDRRFVLVRKSLPQVKKDGQLIIDLDEVKYDYQVIITNIDYLTAEEIFHDYNQRCNVENKIDELKEGFAFDQNSQRNKKCNELYLLIKVIAYNLHNWFKRQILPKYMHHHEITTIRRILYRKVGNIVGNGRYRHIKFAPCTWLKEVITHIRMMLKQFRKQEVFT